MIDHTQFEIALGRFAMGLSSAQKQLRPKTAEEGGKAMAYAVSVSLGAVEMPEDGPMELAWDHWSRRQGMAGERGLALATLAQLIPEPIREEETEARLLGQIALWLDLVAHDDPDSPDSAALARKAQSPEARLAEDTADAALSDLMAARAGLRECLLAEDDSAACDPQRDAVTAAEQQLDAAAELTVAAMF